MRKPAAAFGGGDGGGAEERRILFNTGRCEAKHRVRVLYRLDDPLGQIQVAVTNPRCFSRSGPFTRLANSFLHLHACSHPEVTLMAP